MDPSIIPDPSKHHITIAAVYMRPFSRGNVHLASTDPLALPRIDPNYLAIQDFGSTSMLPLNQGGVVDPNLKVYGTSNVYIADASIIPLEIVTHTMATVYANAHKV
ncbi:hypothetical protein PHLCEN_2v7657 [Hermanssonia centrifuga]|uniref:Glucose-methanol-choline oxidoreductase C-terminal domain-containing protein n=1 Tax=Hermanssonia centrifuga TaxID=98765 RepID=A0A2R6NVY2_9APHY|nr:hypothetical protein PHLCEN_2v7657 [Hermanssonia centrifuga]